MDETADWAIVFWKGVRKVQILHSLKVIFLNFLVCVTNEKQILKTTSLNRDAPIRICEAKHGSRPWEAVSASYDIYQLTSRSSSSGSSIDTSQCIV